ncbi:hypothetical protein ACFYSH_17395 [Streptomyces sp. NPDC005791]|uniref:hypothetical protein n=1 Tax=unclassified Streptomyces TaxID=2593676 RepID=UPI00340F78B7
MEALAGFPAAFARPSPSDGIPLPGSGAVADMAATASPVTGGSGDVSGRLDVSDG